jgi:hypothetical protein
MPKADAGSGLHKERFPSRTHSDCSLRQPRSIMNRTYFDYPDIEHMLERFVVPLRQRHCQVVVAILRGGVFPEAICVSPRRSRCRRRC